MKTFKLYVEDAWEAGVYGAPVLSEELHHEIKNILDSKDIDPKHKLNLFTKKARALLISGQNTGLEDAKPKKGSSRAVFFPSEAKSINLDGKQVNVKTAVKIAFPGKLDRYTGDSMLLGEHQNQVESDPDISGTYGIITEKTPGIFKTNENGVLVPTFGSHPEHHHVEVGRIEKYTADDLRNYTKNKDFKKGISHSEMYDALNHLYQESHGKTHWTKMSPDHIEDVLNHDHVRNVAAMMFDSGMHPGDLSPRNMGVFVHPVTKVRHPVIADYGFTNHIANLYNKARNNLMKKNAYDNWRRM